MQKKWNPSEDKVDATTQPRVQVGAGGEIIEPVAVTGPGPATSSKVRASNCESGSASPAR